MDIDKRVKKRAKRRLHRIKKRAKLRLVEKEEETENELHCEDLLTEILIRASAKTVGRCMCVNKRFNSLISNQNFMDRRSSRPLITDVDGLFHFSTCSTMIYLLPFDNNNSSSSSYKGDHLPPQRLFADNRRCIILASCSGFLLLRFLDDSTNYYLCNPTTNKRCLCIPKFKEKQLLSPMHGNWAGLCIIESSSSSQNVTNFYSYKLVFVYYDASQRYRFIMYSKETGKWKLSKETIACAYSKLFEWNNSVYYRGALHWLREKGDDILAFHVQKEQARMIHIPENVSVRKSESSYQDVWFGVTPRDDLLNMVLVSGNQVVIWVLGDYDNMKWHVERQIETDWIDLTTSLPKFFDGEILVMVQKKIISEEKIIFDAHIYEKKIIFDAHIYNILTGERNTKKLHLWLDGCRVFVPRTNTLMDL